MEIKTVPIAASDLTWLNMDRPTNLIVVNGLMWFDQQPDWDAVREVLQQRLVEAFDVLHRRPVRVGGTWMWQDDPDFDLDRHIRRVTLAAPGDRATAQEYISGRVSQPLDREHPLWEFDFISGYADADGGQGAMLLARFHHALADGIRLVQLILGLCDVAEGATPTVVGRAQSASNPALRVVGFARDAALDMARFAGDLALAVASAVPKVPAAAASLGSHTLHDGWGLVVRPTRAIDAVSALASEDNVALNTWRSASRLTLWGHQSHLVADRAPDVAKKVSWVAGIDLAQVKAVGAAHGATVNDVLLSAVSIGISRYLAEHERPGFVEADWMVPVSLKPIDMSLPKELGNHFAMVMFPMPLGVTDINVLLREVHSRMNRIKHSAEAMMVFGLQRAVAEVPATIAENLTAFVANKTVGLLTNVPGPSAPIFLAGQEVRGALGWVPTSANQGLGLCIFSYNGTVSIGIAADAGMMPDPDRLAELIQSAIADMVASS